MVQKVYTFSGTLISQFTAINQVNNSFIRSSNVPTTFIHTLLLHDNIDISRTLSARSLSVIANVIKRWSSGETSFYIHDPRLYCVGNQRLAVIHASHWLLCSGQQPNEKSRPIERYHLSNEHWVNIESAYCVWLITFSKRWNILMQNMERKVFFLI